MDCAGISRSGIWQVPTFSCKVEQRCEDFQELFSVCSEFCPAVQPDIALRFLTAAFYCQRHWWISVEVLVVAGSSWWLALITAPRRVPCIARIASATALSPGSGLVCAPLQKLSLLSAFNSLTIHVLRWTIWFSIQEHKHETLSYRKHQYSYNKAEWNLHDSLSVCCDCSVSFSQLRSAD